MDGSRLTGSLKLTNSFKLEDSSQNMAVAFDRAKTDTEETEECVLAPLQIKPLMTHCSSTVKTFQILREMNLTQRGSPCATILKSIVQTRQEVVLVNLKQREIKLKGDAVFYLEDCRSQLSGRLLFC